MSGRDVHNGVYDDASDCGCADTARQSHLDTMADDVMALANCEIDLRYLTRGTYAAATGLRPPTAADVSNVCAIEDDATVFEGGIPVVGKSYVVRSTGLTLPKRGDLVIRGDVHRTVVRAIPESGGTLYRITTGDGAPTA